MAGADFTEVYDSLLEAMREAGLRPRLPLSLDGKWHRCPVDGYEHRKDGSYRAYIDAHPTAQFQNHVGGEMIKWKYEGKRLSPAERKKMIEDIERQKKIRAAEERAGYKKSVDGIKAASESFRAADDQHPYLVKKQVHALGDLRVVSGKVLSDLWTKATGREPLALATDADELILPLRDADGKIWSLERILPDGQKRFLPGGKKSGMSFTIPGDDSGPLVIAEGYATAASIHMATGLTVVAAMDCGNEVKVAKELRRKFPQRKILIGADNDYTTPLNPGVTYGNDAARAAGGLTVVPPKLEGSDGADWNDVYIALGKEEVRKAFISSDPPNESKTALEPSKLGTDDKLPGDDEDAPPDGFYEGENVSDVSSDASDFPDDLPEPEPETEPEPKPSPDLPPLPSLLPEKIDELSDVSNAKLLLQLHGNDIRYCRDRRDNGWLVWNGQFWETGAERKVTQMAIGCIEKLAQCGEGLDGVNAKMLAKHLADSRKYRNISAMVSLARTFEDINVEDSQLNAHSWLLNTPTFTLDIKRLKLTKHRREDLLTKMISTEYHVDAECPLWMKFLDTIMNGDTDMMEYLQRAIGYSLTGDTSEQCMFVLYGHGRNGKSTFLQVIKEILGGYARQTSMDTFMTRNRMNNISDDLANLKGARFVVASESEENGRLAESTIKQVTGGGAISARRLYENLIEYEPEFKLWLDTNHKPIIRGTDFGIWRRLRLIPFTVEIPDDKVDLQLIAKLRLEFPGILAWAVKGAKEWLESGLGHPAMMEAATREYRREMDSVGRFLDECCITGDERYTIRSGELYDMYENWVRDNGEDFHKLSQIQLGVKLKERGMLPKRNFNLGRYWSGVTAKPDGYEGGDSDVDASDGFSGEQSVSY